MNSITTWNPIRELFAFPSSSTDPLEGFRMTLAEPNGWSPAADVSEDDDSFQVSVDLPEVKKEDISVSVDRGYLTIS